MRKYAVNPMYNHINQPEQEKSDNRTECIHQKVINIGYAPIEKLHNLNREGREHADKQNLIKSKNKVFISFLPDKIRRLPKLHPKMAEP